METSHRIPPAAELSAAQKGAIVRSIHNPSVHLSFTEGHPRKAAAAEAYRSEMLAKFQAQAAAVGEEGGPIVLPLLLLLPP